MIPNEKGTLVSPGSSLLRFDINNANTDLRRLEIGDVVVLTGIVVEVYNTKWTQVMSRHGLIWMRVSRLDW
jgi:hypothetical protein